jgi:uncharacterized protein
VVERRALRASPFIHSRKGASGAFSFAIGFVKARTPLFVLGDTMALQLRPNCEYCDIDLPPGAENARICTYECTFCADCVETRLHNVCPNCGGGFVPRPIRPVTAWRPETSLAFDPPSTKRIHLRFGREEVAAFSEAIRNIPPSER